MKLEDLSPEQAERAKACSTQEERLGFLREQSIELTDEQLDEVVGGAFTPGQPGAEDVCPAGGSHEYARTGNKRPSSLFGDLWPDYEYSCKKCGATTWKSW